MPFIASLDFPFLLGANRWGLLRLPKVRSSAKCIRLKHNTSVRASVLRNTPDASSRTGDNPVSPANKDPSSEAVAKYVLVLLHESKVVMESLLESHQAPDLYPPTCHVPSDACLCGT
jgi:hypothetical protein